MLKLQWQGIPLHKLPKNGTIPTCRASLHSLRAQYSPSTSERKLIIDEFHSKFVFRRPSSCQYTSDLLLVIKVEARLRFR